MKLKRKFDKIYKSIENLNKSFGTYKKAEMHIHTPASHDYRLYSNKNEDYYKKLSSIQILEIAKEEGLFNATIYESYKQIIGTKEEKKFIEKLKEFVSLKEYITYLLIVNKLVKDNIEVAVITDHNTIDGYKKIKKARDIFWKTKRGSFKYLHLFLGVEISCGDKNHLICIVDNKDEEKIKKYLEENINDRKEGTYKTSLQVIDEITQKCNSLVYIAHLNSSDIFKSAGVYKKELFNLENFKYIGLSDINEREKIERKINSSVTTKKEFYYLHEGDSHGIDELAIKNIWIKFEKVNFGALKKAFENFNTCIRNEAPSDVNKYIKGIYVLSGKYGFLNSKPNAKEKDIFAINFSKDLNCIIGGRGSGKSTILKFIDAAFTLNVENLGVLKVISSHDTLYIIFHFKGDDYILEMIPQVEFDLKGSISFVNWEWRNKDVNYNEPVKINEYWRRLHKVNKINENTYNYEEIKDISEKYKILYQFFKTGYSINDLVNKIQSNKVNDILKGIMAMGMPSSEEYIEEIYEIIDSKESYGDSDIKEILLNIKERVEKQNNIIDKKVKEFNKLHENTFIIKHENKIGPERCDFNIILGKEKSQYFMNTILRWQQIKELVNLQISKIGMFDYIWHLINKNYETLEKQVSILKLKDKLTIEDIHQGLVDFERDKINILYDKIREIIFKDRKVTSGILEILADSDNKYYLMFNIANNETNKNGEKIFRPIQRTSLGQQVAAMLNFIIEYGKFVNDDTPLIIDQPEDNLDNQYIYKNLVKSLRDIKNKRQIIIATHNSTIVTNSDTEQVIVMESNNLHGWIKNRGYITDNRIMKCIIDNLEGGIDSFKHKENMYSSILNNK